MAKPRHRRTDPKRNPHGCDGAGNPIIHTNTPIQSNGASGVYQDENGQVYADITPIDPSIQAQIDKILQPAKK